MTAPYIIQIIIGFIGLISLAVPFSNNAKIINYKYIAYGVLSQIILAAILLKIPLVVDAFAMLGEGVTILQKATVEGAGFVFGYPPSDSAALFPSLLQTFAFGVLPYIIVMSCISAILWYWGGIAFYCKYTFKSLSEII
ncbi:hypothetical protein N8999_01535 [Gammaproteobacteria bacterium]|nr:hypothetical protein [Gammaproteobacteria bacterium]